MVSDDGDCVVVFNGEIYNHAALRSELEQLGHRFASHCDTEVVLHAFLQWDAACFSRFRGMFAVGVWSESKRRLILARDRIGIKPLYWYRRGTDVYFGSELKAILEHSDVPRRLDLAALSQYLSLNYVPGPRTLVEGIEKVPPGHLLEWRSGEVRTEPYWRLEFHPQKGWTLATAKEQLDALLQQSVKEHLAADVPVGVWSSGGVDSSTILHYAASARSAPLQTFSVSFAGRSFDETRYFREIARIYGTDHHEFDLNADAELQSSIEEFACYSDEPGADAGALPVWFLSRMCRQQVTVALSGDGADELFGGYLTYQADRWARPLRWIPRFARHLMLRAFEHYLPVSDEKISLEYKLRRFIEGSLLSPSEAHFYWNGTFSDEQKQALFRKPLPGDLTELIRRLPAASDPATDIHRYLFADQHYYLPDDILYKVDRMSMAHSLEVRPPFLDHRIVEFAASLPLNLKIRGFTQKYILKELMKGKLPSSVIRRQKTGFDIPTHDWFRGILRLLLLDTLTPEAIGSTGLFNAAAVQELVRDHLERRVNVGYHLWGLLMLFLWMKRWRIEVPPASDHFHQKPAGVLTIN